MKRKLNKKKYIISVIIICVIALLTRLVIFPDSENMITPLATGTVFLFFGAYYICSKPEK